MTIQSAEPATGFPGIDKLVLGPVPRSIRNGEVEVVAIVDGQISNAVTFAFKQRGRECGTTGRIGLCQPPAAARPPPESLLRLRRRLRFGATCCGSSIPVSGPAGNGPQMIRPRLPSSDSSGDRRFSRVAACRILKCRRRSTHMFHGGRPIPLADRTFVARTQDGRARLTTLFRIGRPRRKRGGCREFPCVGADPGGPPQSEWHAPRLGMGSPACKPGDSALPQRSPNGSLEVRARPGITFPYRLARSSRLAESGRFGRRIGLVSEFRRFPLAWRRALSGAGWQEFRW